MARRPHLIVLAAGLAAPATALAGPMTVANVFQNATPFVQMIMLALVLATLAALVVCGMKLMSGPSLSGGSAFLSGLRLGGPIAGGLGAAYSILNMCIGLANVAVTPTLKVLAPGFAEAVLMIGLGMFTGVVAVIANWAVEARVDRAVLRTR